MALHVHVKDEQLSYYLLCYTICYHIDELYDIGLYALYWNLTWSYMPHLIN